MSGGGTALNKRSKDRVEVILRPSELAQRYIAMLNRVGEQYAAKYSWSARLVSWDVVEPTGIQYYKPGGGYKIWRFERDDSSDQIARWHLAFMT